MIGQRMKAAWRAFQGKRDDNFKGSQSSRLLSEWLATTLTPDDQMRWSLHTLRARSRDLERNNPIIRHFLRMLSINVIGPNGIRLQSQVRNNDGQLNKLINDRIEKSWNEWCRSNVTVDGRLGLNDLSRLSLRTLARDGEVIFRKWRAFPDNPHGFALEPIEGDMLDESFNRVKSPDQNEIRLGVEINPFGRPVAYHLWDRPERIVASIPRKRERVPADQIMHLYDPERIGQVRGSTWLNSTMVAARHLDGYVEAELIAARISASKMAFFQRKTEGGGALPENMDLRMEAEPGTMGFLPDGYEVADWNPDHPAAAFGAFVKDAMRRIATGLDVSYNALASDLENVNYSSMRSGLLIERDVWMLLQQYWINSFLFEVYKEWLNMALLHSALVLPDSRDYRRYLDVKWRPRGWQWVDPLKETEAGVLAIQNGLASRQDLLSEQGKDIEEVLEQLAEEKAMGAPESAPKPASPNATDSTNGGGRLAAFLKGE